ncbi:MAG: hypothetical protein E6Q94_04015 [Burkholderiaceae bacterium]|nr:MAG: hypothetical protein E6Q94_04015 [Burkholderiaceae bacterium]
MNSPIEIRKQAHHPALLGRAMQAGLDQTLPAAAIEVAIDSAMMKGFYLEILDANGRLWT